MFTRTIYHQRRYDSSRRREERHYAQRPVRKTGKPAPGEAVRFVALGGFEEIGRNMMFFEYRDEIIIIDAGLEFPREETPGIDYIIPNVSDLAVRKQNIKALIITHGHYDHIGAIPYIMDKIGNPFIYTTQLTREIIMRRQEEFPHAPKLNFKIVKAGETHRLSEHFSAEFFAVVHTIPEGFGVILDTPIGKVVHPGEFKFDYDHDGKARGLDTWKAMGKKGIHTLMLDSTGAEVPGWTVSERVVEHELEKLFKAAPGRILVGTFASLLDRIGEIIKIAEKLGRKVAVAGFSMKINIEIAQRLGYLKIQRGTIIPVEKIDEYDDKKLLILCTGAQGEPNASLMRIANGEHRHIKLNPADTIILSSSIVPGNERSVQIIKDNMARQGPTIYHFKMLDIHSSGHAPIEELKTVMRLVKPRFFLPIHGYYFMRLRNAKHAQEELGLKPEETVLTDNGRVVEFRKDSVRVTDEQVSANYVLVDGLGVGDVGEVVLRDRQALAQDGMFVIIATIDSISGRVRGNPDIISRGFVYLRESKELLDETRRRVRRIVEDATRETHPVNWAYVRDNIRDKIGAFLFQKTKRRPMVLPVVIEI